MSKPTIVAVDDDPMALQAIGRAPLSSLPPHMRETGTDCAISGGYAGVASGQTSSSRVLRST
jgi:hypothetical protein